MNAAVYIATKMATDKLTELELAAVNNAAQLGTDPRGVLGYERVKHLFSEQNGTAMHSETKDALARIVLDRLPTPALAPPSPT